MAERVFVHIGLPKTATTYLQTIMWRARDQMRDDGVLLPGEERADHLWSSRIVRDDPKVERSSTKHRTAWERVLADVAQWPGTALISHEFFAAASAEQAARMVAALGAREAHVVVTAREPIGLFTTSWQESLKNRETAPLADYPGPDSDDPRDVWNWRTLDLGLVLRRWGPAVTADRVHVLPLPGKGAPRDLIWQRFAGLVGLDPASYDASSGFANSSMGIAEAETLRRVNERLVERGLLKKAVERGTTIRTYLADERLVTRNGDRFWPGPEQIADCRRRGEAALELIRSEGYDVVGDLADLEPPAELPERRTAESVTDAEVAAIATDLVAQLAADVRRLRVESRRMRRELAVPAVPVPVPIPSPWHRFLDRARSWLAVHVFHRTAPVGTDQQ